MKKLVVFLVLVCGGVAGGYAVWNHRKNGAEKGTAATEKARVERGPIRLTVASTGRVMSNLDVEIKCKASGQIMKLPFDISDEVEPGQLLLELDPVDENRNVQRAEVELSASKARQAQAQLNLETAEQQLVNDEKTAKANLVAAEAASKDAKAKADRMRQLLETERVSKEECETAETAATRASVELQNANIRLKEIDVQRQALDVRRQDVALAKTQVESDQIALDMAKQRLKETKVYAPMTAGDTMSTRALVARANAARRPRSFGGERGMLEGSQRGGRRFEGPPGSGRGAFGAAGSRFGESRGMMRGRPNEDTSTTGSAFGPGRAGMRSGGFGGQRGLPGGSRRGGRRGEGRGEMGAFDLATAGRRFADGGGDFLTAAEDEIPTGPKWVVATRDVQIGQIISSPMNNVGGGTALMTLSDLSRIFVIASVDESDIGKVNLGQRVSITADAFPNRTFAGEVVRIATRGANVSNVVTFEVKIEVKGRGKENLKPEMTANVEIIVAEAEDALLLPSEAIRREGRQQYVEMPGAEGEPAVKREVTTGIDDGFQVQVLAGLQEGDEVLVPELGTQSRWARGDRSEAMRQRMRSGMMMRSMGGRRGRR